MSKPSPFENRLQRKLDEAIGYDRSVRECMERGHAMTKPSTFENRIQRELDEAIGYDRYMSERMKIGGMA